MNGPDKKSTTVDEYIAARPAHIAELLEQMRATIRKVAPAAEEVISYSMPAFRLNGMLVWYAAHKDHIGFYPRASGIEVFKKELSKYKSSKGAVQFPISEPLPLALVTRMVKYRVKENAERAVKAKK